MQDLEIGAKYKHYKNKDHIYEIVGVARHSETLEEIVVYKALYESEDFGKDCLWVRPKEMFLESVTIPARPHDNSGAGGEGKEVKRFEKID